MSSKVVYCIMIYGDRMKKNINILEYVEKYKYKYGISYAQEGGKLVKVLSIITGVVWIYSFFMLALSILSFALNFSAGALEYSDLSNVFITTIICAVTMVIAAVLFVCKQKIAFCIVTIAIQPFIVLAYEPISVYGMGYVAGFYWKYAVPAILLVLFSAILLFILIRAKVKTNKLYNMLVDGLYKQYGTRDGEKLTDAEWQEFLSNYNPYKQII